jgi:hypothetical protein
VRKKEIWLREMGKLPQLEKGTNHGRKLLSGIPIIVSISVSFLFPYFLELRVFRFHYKHHT